MVTERERKWGEKWGVIKRRDIRQTVYYYYYEDIKYKSSQYVARKKE